ncbi:response regulator transcription factor [Hyalangium rubrum]|uniref:Response regulator transcription factor n=1 Tax=Hyalangium rubrum TaxID=3103134 RepID=A0ABU5HDA4_9BACT|nr:response regulator transcription factor [Hyalangium sp. s54d21]MDY7231438.1 response regulator transcription factor [Hyalangium sp. s54d21]
MSPPTAGPRVLVVEDDPNLRLTLVDNLEEEGYAVQAASTLSEARTLWKAGADVVVLDIMLPDGDGYTLCREMRQAGTSSRVLMLTARTLEDDVVRGFDVGADDYLAKPYRLRELLARIRALSRRGAPATPAAEVLAFDRFRVDLESRRLLDERGQALELTRTEFDLLVYLLRNAGKALTRDQILAAVWGEDTVVDAHTVDNFVSNLRKKLEWTSASRFEIRSVRGVGYRMDLLA